MEGQTWSWIWPLYPDIELNLRDRVLDAVWKNSFIALSGKCGHSSLIASKLCVPTWKSFIVIVQRGHDQLLDILLISWWWGKWESASLIFFWGRVVPPGKHIGDSLLWIETPRQEQQDIKARRLGPAWTMYFSFSKSRDSPDHTCVDRLLGGQREAMSRDALHSKIHIG